MTRVETIKKMLRGLLRNLVIYESKSSRLEKALKGRKDSVIIKPKSQGPDNFMKPIYRDGQVVGFYPDSRFITNGEKKALTEAKRILRGNGLTFKVGYYGDWLSVPHSEVKKYEKRRK